MQYLAGVTWEATACHHRHLQARRHEEGLQGVLAQRCEHAKLDAQIQWTPLTYSKWDFILPRAYRETTPGWATRSLPRIRSCAGLTTGPARFRRRQAVRTALTTTKAWTGTISCPASGCGPPTRCGAGWTSARTTPGPSATRTSTGRLQEERHNAVCQRDPLINFRVFGGRSPYHGDGDGRHVCEWLSCGTWPYS